MGLLVRSLRPSGLTHGRPPCSSLSSPGDVVPMVLNLITDKMGDPDIPTITCLIGTQKFDQVLVTLELV
jgi:hypothetical protein